MSSPWAAWFEALPSFAGLLAAGVRVPDQATHSKSWVGSWPEAALANAWRCVDDTFRVMRLHRFPTRQLRWTYAEALLTSVRRDDGSLLTVLTKTELSRTPKPPCAPGSRHSSRRGKKARNGRNLQPRPARDEMV